MIYSTILRNIKDTVFEKSLPPQPKCKKKTPNATEEEASWWDATCNRKFERVGTDVENSLNQTYAQYFLDMKVYFCTIGPCSSLPFSMSFWNFIVLYQEIWHHYSCTYLISFTRLVPVLRISEPCAVHDTVPYLKFKSVNVSVQTWKYSDWSFINKLRVSGTLTNILCNSMLVGSINQWVKDK